MTETEDPDSEDRSVKSKVLFFSFVFLTFAGYIGLDLLTPCSFNDAELSFFLVMLLVGQLTLICVWGTLVEGAFWFRLPWTMLLLVVSWAALCTGVYLDNGSIHSAEVVGLGMVWFYGFAISYVPLKIAAWAFRWRIHLLNKDPAISGTGRYAIRDLMLGTTILAVTMAIGRQFVPGELPQWSEVVKKSGMDHPEFLAVFFVFSGISLIVKLPCIWISLAAAKGKILMLSVIWVFCAGAFGFLEIVILSLILDGSLGSASAEAVRCLIFGHAVMAATMIGVLYGLRCFGYRMTRKKSLTLMNGNFDSGAETTSAR